MSDVTCFKYKQKSHFADKCTNGQQTSQDKQNEKRIRAVNEPKKRYHVDGMVNGVPTELILDTGAEISLVPDELGPKLQYTGSVHEVYGAGFKRYNAKRALVQFDANGLSFAQKVVVVSPEYYPHVLLSMDEHTETLLKDFLGFHRDNYDLLM